jgi:D-3-phosphoglycerate dehydrogenase / 2-oxoglutarate reductase
MQAVFVDATEALAIVAERLTRASGVALRVNRQPGITPDALPDLIGDASVVLIDHTRLPVEVAKGCRGLRHVVFLGTGARSYMDPEALSSIGIEVHTISGYGDTAVAEMTVSLMWAAAKSLARMDRAMRVGNWLRTEGIQLTGKTLGLVGFGAIAKQVVRLTPQMRLLAWNRTPKQYQNVEFVGIETLLRESDVVSLHLLLTSQTRGFLSAEKMAQMRTGAILINTARGGLVDENAMIASLRSGTLAHAALDVFEQEPLPPNHPLISLGNVTLSAHSAFRTPEATDNLIGQALAQVRGISEADR